MADPAFALTYNAFRLRVAEYLGIAYYGAAGDEAAQIPSDAHDLDKVSRIVNDAYRRFIAEHKRGWNFLTVPFTITFGSGLVSSDPQRYFLPDDFYGILVAPFTYPTGGPRITIEPISEVQLRELSWSNTTGVPTVCALRAINTTAATTTGRWEVLFWPIPNGTQSVTAIYKRYPAPLSTGTDRPISGFQHDQTLLEGCLAAAELSVGDAQGPHKSEYKELLGMSMDLDARASAQKISDYGDKSEDFGGPRRPKTYYGVDTYNGVSIL